MSDEVPEAGLPRKASIQEHVEAVDAEQGGVALSSRKHVQSGPGKSNVTDYIRTL